MDPQRLNRLSEYEWEIPVSGPMRVPAVIFASEKLITDMDQKVFEQATKRCTRSGPLVRRSKLRR